MHILIINFALESISAEQYGVQVDSVAPAFAELPGLASKIWLANEATNTYGGVYVWQDREAMEAYTQSDIYKGMVANSYIQDVSVKDFAVLEGPTRITRGSVEAALKTAD